MKKAQKIQIITPRGKLVVISKLESVTKKNGIIFDSFDKKETYLIRVKVEVIGDSEDCKDINEGSIMLCRPDDLQTFQYKGSEYYLIDEAYLMGYLND